MKAASNFPVARPSASCGECLLEIVTSIFGSSSRSTCITAGSHSGSHPLRNPSAKRPLLRISGPARRFAGRLDLSQRHPRVIEKRPAGRRQLDPTRAAYQELDADFQFQVADLPAQ